MIIYISVFTLTLQMQEKLFNNFNFSLLDDPRFKEESVREELLVPLIKDLGYTNSGNTQIIRNHGLKHPFVSIGSSRKRVTIIPDYLMQVSEKPAWILEAKSPFEEITNTKHIEQAYSYAIHPEIRVNYFALCNGHHFTLYNITRSKPLFHISLRAIDLYRKMLRELLSPLKVFSYPDFSITKDFGLHIKRLGFTHLESFLAIDIKPLMIVKYHDDHFSFSAPVGNNQNAYFGTFDFSLKVAEKLRSVFGEKIYFQLLQPTNGKILQFHLDREVKLNIKISLPEKEELIENETEIYLPLVIQEFII